MTIPYRVLCVTLVVVISGCSSMIRVSEVPNSVAAGTTIDGIPFRSPKRFVAVIYQKTTAGYQEVTRQPIVIADPDHLYVLGFRSQPFSNATIDLTLNPDNTLQQVALKSTSTGANATAELGKQVGAISAASKAQQKSDKASVTASADLAIAADKAKQAADLASLEYYTLQSNPKASPEDLLKAAQKERSAKLDANEAARLARKVPYFPDVLP